MEITLDIKEDRRYQAKRQKLERDIKRYTKMLKEFKADLKRIDDEEIIREAEKQGLAEQIRNGVSSLGNTIAMFEVEPNKDYLETRQTRIRDIEICSERLSNIRAELRKLDEKEILKQAKITGFRDLIVKGVNDGD